MENILEIKKLNKKYAEYELKDVDITLKKGYIMGFIGPNGAGKTTTIKLIMNLIKKNSGEIKIFGIDNIAHEKEVKDRIGFVYDDCNYYENLTVKENAKIVSDFYTNWSWEDFDRYIKEFEIKQQQKIKELSKGMKTKFAIAVALSHKAELLIMDEPTSGLDPVFRAEIIKILQEYIEDGDRSILFSTHILSDIEKMADYITFINKGQIIFSEEKTTIEDEYAIVKGGLDIIEDIKSYLIGIKQNSFGFSGLTLRGKEVMQKFGSKIIVERPSIEDVMLCMVGDIK